MLSKPRYRLFCLPSFIAAVFIILEAMTPASANRDIARTWTYHNATKHSEWSIRRSPHYLDWSNRPIPLKIYTTIEAIPLPRDAEQTGIAALSAIAASSAATDIERIPRLEDLARVLYFSAGITKKKGLVRGLRALECVLYRWRRCRSEE